MLDFINSVNHGWEPRHSAAGLYLLRHGDSDRPVTGAPSIPSEWRDYLLRQPVTGRITSVADARHAEIDLGRRHGLRVGMVLWAELTPTAMFPAEVTRVTPNTSEVMVESTYRQSFVVGQRVRSRDRP
ncbi:MAG TPA: hypothetical protein VJM31_00980 [Vicinamibacterales bacterium]|nr:hypothetical protein [Vicinamibacterales bacterium]